MALSKPLFSHLKTLAPHPSRRLPFSAARLLSFATPEEAAAERRRRKRQLRIQPPISSHRQPQQQRQPPNPRSPSNPNAPKLPEPLSALAGNRLALHNRILGLVRDNDLDEAALLVRHSIYSNCRPTVFTCNAVLHALLRQCRYADLLSLHRFITQASVAPTVATHNLLLQAYLDCRKTDLALDHYRLVTKDDPDTAPFAPSPTTFRILVRGLVDSSKLEQAVEIKDDMLAKKFCGPDAQVYNFLISGFVKNDDPDRALALYDEMKEKLGGGPVYDSTIYGSLMKGYFKKGMEKEATELYHEVVKDGSEVKFGALLGAASYNSILNALGKNGRLEDAIGLFDRMISEHTPPKRTSLNLGSFNVMVDAFCAAGKFDDAVSVFKSMGEKGCVPDVMSYNNLIDQLGRNRLVAEAEELYREMGESKINPDEYTYVLIIEACLSVDRIDDAVAYFRKMVESGLRPNAAAYNKVIGGLVAVARIDEAKEFFDMMLEKGVKPNIASYELLLQQEVEIGRLDDALKTFKNILMDEGVTMSPGTKDLMEEALRKEGREEELGRLFEVVEKEKAEALARAAEEKARAEALAKEEEERKKAEAAAKEAAAAKASAAAIEAVLGRKKSVENKEEGKEELLAIGASAADGALPKEAGNDSTLVAELNGDAAAESAALKDEKHESSSEEESKD